MQVRIFSFVPGQKNCIISINSVWSYLSSGNIYDVLCGWSVGSNEVLRGLLFTYAYVDDLLIASHSPQEHLEDLRSVLEKLDAHGILINVTKSVFGVPL